MSNQSSAIVQRLWNYCTVLRDDGLSYGDYVEQLTYLLFLKMDDERRKIGDPSTIPNAYAWTSLVTLDGNELESHYRQILTELGQGRGLIPTIFRKAQNRIQDPAKLKRLVTLIDGENWHRLNVDVKADIYEGLLEKNAQDVKSGAGQYFTPRPLIQAIVDVMQPKPGDTLCDPACGTGGFLLAAYDYVGSQKHHQLDRDQWLQLRQDALHGWEIVDNTARLCVMNLYLHGIGHENGHSPIHVDDALANKPTTTYDMVLTNPPFGKKSSVTYITEEGEVKREAQTVVRDDFWTSTSNKQLNFVQHVHKLLKQHGKAAVVVPDNVLFEGGAGETVRRKLLQESDLHTILRLPTGIFYAQGVKANVLFFDRKPGREKPWTDTIWFYDYRTNVHHTLKQNPLTRADLDEFVACFNPVNRHERAATWDEGNENGRFRPYTLDDILARDKVNLDIFWLRDETLEDSDNLPDPDVLAVEIVEELEAALAQFRLIAEDMGGEI
jgi:type I restriction enzyme M protein